MKGKVNAGQTLEVQIAYIHGRIEAQLEGFAHSIQVPAQQLTDRVAALLLSEEGRKVLGAVHSVSGMRPAATGRRKASRKVAVAKRAPGRKTPVSGYKLYWAKMTPEQRSAEIKRRLLVGKHKKAVA